MPITRTRVSSDYIKPNGSSSTCPNNVTRTRISGDYIKANQGVPFFGRTITRTPYYSSLPIFSNVIYPSFCMRQPVISHPVVVYDTENTVAGALVFTIVAIGIIAIIALAPHCHNEEVCTDLFNGLSNCHLERVCVSLI